MTGLISREVLEQELKGLMFTKGKTSVIMTRVGEEIYNSAIEAAIFATRNAITIDAVQVVRCRDCIHAVAITNLTIANRCGLEQKNCMRQRGDDGFGFAGVSVVYPDGFCDEGARMDGESKEETDGSQTD